MSPRRWLGWEPAEVTTHYDPDWNVTGHSITTREPEYDTQDRALIAASWEREREPRGQHGIPIAEATDPARQYEWVVDLPTRDFAQQKLNAAREKYRKEWGDTADMDSLLWQVRGAERAPDQPS